MRRAAIAAVLVVVAAVAVVLIARGGDEEGCGDGYPSTPGCMAEAFATREDASKCDLVAQEALEEVLKLEGEAARERCRTNVAGHAAPDEIQILEAEREGEKKHTGETEAAEREGEDGDVVEVEYLAGGKEGEIVVRKEDGRWRIVEFGVG